jgi:hypothetical protein
MKLMIAHSPITHDPLPAWSFRPLDRAAPLRLARRLSANSLIDWINSLFGRKNSLFREEREIACNTLKSFQKIACSAAKMAAFLANSLSFSLFSGNSAIRTSATARRVLSPARDRMAREMLSVSSDANARRLRFVSGVLPTARFR